MQGLSSLSENHCGPVLPATAVGGTRVRMTAAPAASSHLKYERYVLHPRFGME